MPLTNFSEKVGDVMGKINKRSCQISNKLFSEIEKSMDNLNSIEKQLRMGKKKKNYTFIEVSDKLGSMLEQLRKQKKEKKEKTNEDIFKN